jgi:hypothetical protein
MFTLHGQSRHACDGVDRRQILQAAGAGLLGLSLPGIMAAETAAPARRARARSVIFLFLYGGPSQHETFDPKPAAPAEIRGPFRAIPTRTPGLLMSEHLPRLAAQSDRFTVIRTMTHPYNDHSGAGHYLQTGKRWHLPIGGGFSATPRDWPSMGSVVEYLNRANAQRELPSYAVVPNRLGRLQDAGQYVRPGEYAGWLGRTYNPLTTVVDKRNSTDNPYWRDCSDEELTFQIEGLASPHGLHVERVRGRESLLQQFEARRRELLTDQRSLQVHDRFRQRALALVTSDDTRRALDIRREAPAVRDRYGRHLFGQSALMARRLVEAGLRFVTVHYDCVDGYSWDSHVQSNDLRDHLLPTFDQALSALLTDLDERGRLDETLVVALGEMGRTPVTTPRWGRQHWSTLFPAVVAGAGIRRGGLYGASDKDAAYPVDHPVSPEDLAATIYTALGIDPHLALPDTEGRPVTLVEGGRALVDLFG